MTRDQKSILLLFSFVTLFALVFVRIHNEKIFSIGYGDDEAYFAYPRSLVIDGDWNFDNEPTATFDKQPDIAPKYPIGAGILWIPFFALGHVAGLLSQVDPPDLLAKGISVTHWLATGIGSAALGIFGLFLLYLFLRKFFSPTASLWTTLLIPLGSPLSYYLFRRPLMSHAAEFFSLTLACYVLSFMSSFQKYRHWFGAGVAVGFIFLCRWTNAPYVAGFCLFVLYSLFKDRDFRLWKEKLKKPSLFFVGVGLTGMVQLVIWKMFIGHWSPGTAVYGENYIRTDNFLFKWNSWTGWRFGDVLFGIDWGLFMMTPIVLLLVVWGSIKVYQYVPKCLVNTLLLSSLMVLFIIVNWTGHGGEYGHRYLISLWVLFSLFHAAILDSLRTKPLSQRIFLTLSICSFLFSSLLLVEFKTNDDTLTVKLQPAKNIVKNDFANFEYTKNATLNMIQMVKDPVYGASLFSPSPFGYLGYRFMTALKVGPASLFGPYEAYLDKKLPHRKAVPLGRFFFFWFWFVGGGTLLALFLARSRPKIKSSGVPLEVRKKRSFPSFEEVSP